MTPADGPAPPEPALRIPDWLQVVLLAALWLVTHPYRGIIHDGRLYTVQALNQLDPATFAQDLFFKYGSQDSFTIFSALYKPLVALAGPPLAHALATGIGQALWFAALLLLMRTLFGRGALFLLAAAACIAMESYYGGVGVFHYGEVFATPRLYAEALVMSSIALAIRRRFLLMVLSLLLGAIMHPIMTLTGVAFLVLIMALYDHRAWLLGLAGAGAGLTLACLGVEPFSRIWLQFDPEWFRIVAERCAFGVVGRWFWTDFLQIAATLAILGVGAAFTAGLERRILLAAAIGAVIGLVVTAVGGDLLHNILVINIQLWRMLWIATLFANAWTVVLAYRTPRHWVSRELLFAAIFCATVASFLDVARLASIMVTLAACMALLVDRRLGRPAGALRRLIYRGLVGLALGFVGLVVFAAAKEPTFVQSLLGVGAVALVIGCGALLASGAAWANYAVWFLLIGAVAGFDRRQDWTRYIETERPDPSLLAFVGDAPNVYWENGAELQWLKLRKPIYYSCIQSAGAMFYRGTAIEYRRRSDLLSVLNSRDFLKDDRHLCAARRDLGETRGPQSRAQLAAACQALPEMDVIILSRPVPAVRAVTWRAPAERIFLEPGDTNPTRITRYYRYACADLRGAEPRT